MGVELIRKTLEISQGEDAPDYDPDGWQELYARDVGSLIDDVERLQKVADCAKRYVDVLGTDPQLAGEHWRDLEATVQWLTDQEVDYGWPGCYRRLEEKLERLKTQHDRLLAACKALREVYRLFGVPEDLQEAVDQIADIVDGESNAKKA